MFLPSIPYVTPKYFTLFIVWFFFIDIFYTIHLSYHNSFLNLDKHFVNPILVQSFLIFLPLLLHFTVSAIISLFLFLFSLCYISFQVPHIFLSSLFKFKWVIIFRIKTGGVKWFFLLHRSPNQGREESESFCTNFNLFLSNANDLNPAFSIITGDFNARSTEWWKVDKENFEGYETKIITHATGYSQLINQHIYITKDSLSCIDLIFTSNPNSINSSSVEMSLFEKCYRKIVYGKITFQIPKNASTESIQRSVSSIDWDF